jgi:peptidoglycan/xylan/chitin deacetylase (PgdA/CDA1 family)
MNDLIDINNIFPHPHKKNIAVFTLSYFLLLYFCKLTEIKLNYFKVNERNLNVESTYDYGSRCGFWRLHRLFTSRKVPVTVWAVGMALERNMEVVGAIKQQEDWEVSSHGYRWWDYQNIDEKIEKEHIQRSIAIHQNLFGKPPVGFYQGKPSKNTRRLAVEAGGFLYDSDSYNDDLPYWSFDYGEEGKPHLIIPYTLVENDMLYTQPQGWSKPDDFLNHLKRTLE